MNDRFIVHVRDLRRCERLLFLVLLLALACTDRRTHTRPPASRSIFATADSLRTFGAAEPALALYRTLRDSLAGVKDSAGFGKPRCGRATA